MATGEVGGEGAQSETEPPPAEEPGKGLALALRFLNRRERTVAEVRARLRRAEIPEVEFEGVIVELLELGLLDDARYARVFTQDKRTLAAWGNERIVRVLRERGVARELIEAAVTEPATDDLSAPDGERGSRPGSDGAWGGPADDASGRAARGGELSRALSLLRQRFGAGPADPRDRSRAFGVLARRGYDRETAADAVREWARGGEP